VTLPLPLALSLALDSALALDVVFLKGHPECNEGPLPRSFPLRRSKLFNQQSILTFLRQVTGESEVTQPGTQALGYDLQKKRCSGSEHRFY
jgi:hypothetical protein